MSKHLEWLYISKQETQISLAELNLHAVSAFAAACARPALEFFERVRPGDSRVREAIEAAEGFAAGGRRTKVLRDRA